MIIQKRDSREERLIILGFILGILLVSCLYINQKNSKEPLFEKQRFSYLFMFLLNKLKKLKNRSQKKEK